MLEELKRLPDAGVVGCKLLNTDQSIQTSCIQKFPTIPNQLADFEYLRLRWPKFICGVSIRCSRTGRNPCRSRLFPVHACCSNVKHLSRRNVYRRLFHVRRGFGSLLQGPQTGAAELLRRKSGNHPSWGSKQQSGEGKSLVGSDRCISSRYGSSVSKKGSSTKNTRPSDAKRLSKCWGR